MTDLHFRNKLNNWKVTSKNLLLWLSDSPYFLQHFNNSYFYTFDKAWFDSWIIPACYFYLCISFFVYFEHIPILSYDWQENGSVLGTASCDHQRKHDVLYVLFAWCLKPVGFHFLNVPWSDSIFPVLFCSSHIR